MGIVFALYARKEIMAKLGDMWKVALQTIKGFAADKVFKMAASLSFSTVIALPALLIIVIWITSFFYDPADVESGVVKSIGAMIGGQAISQIQELLINTKFDYMSGWAKTLGVITLIISATGVFGEIQDSINTIWGLKAKPKSGWIKLLVNRLMSFSIVLSLGFILVVSLIANAMITGVSEYFRTTYAHVPVALFYAVNQLVTAVVLVLLFGAIFKVLPDAKIIWKDVLLSAIITTLLFMIGKYGIEIFLDRNATVTAYGSAGSVIVILLWVYYSSLILYLGAEFTQAFHKVKGRHIAPNKYAVWVEKEEIVVSSNKEVEKETEPQPVKK
ncbi:MAG TPA: YihY/virulence factor BrkB family protein [Bacteroidia bacterium]|nr:YihY/virulence factor BrkB family protein [Bacteroidia bacterium]